VAEPAPRVAALLLNWRRADLTLQCLGDLLASRSEPLCVVVIDNGSGDGSAERLRSALATMPTGPHQVELLALPDNLGFCGGMNRGIARAEALGCAFTLVLNNDLRLPEECVRGLADTLANDPRVAAVGPTVLHPDGTVWAQGGELAFAPNAVRLRGHGRAPAPRELGPQAVAFLPAACVLYRTAALAAVGGFDERFFMYWEDVDLCDRLAARGGRIVWLPWLRVVHAAGGSSGGGRSPLRKFMMACNAVHYLRARRSLRAWLAWLCFDLLLWPVTFVLGPKPALAKLHGTWAGLAGYRPGAADVQRYCGG
jgi:GT2 family glycosyltransferase